MSTSRIVPYELLKQKIHGRLSIAGITAGQAQVEAEIMTEADLHGVASHEVRMLPGLLAALADGRVNKHPQFSLQRQFGAIAVMDCDNGPGRYAAQNAMQHANAAGKSPGSKWKVAWN